MGLLVLSVCVAVVLMRTLALFFGRRCAGLAVAVFVCLVVWFAGDLWWGRFWVGFDFVSLEYRCVGCVWKWLVEFVGLSMVFVTSWGWWVVRDRLVWVDVVGVGCGAEGAWGRWQGEGGGKGGEGGLWITLGLVDRVLVP